MCGKRGDGRLGFLSGAGWWLFQHSCSAPRKGSGGGSHILRQKHEVKNVTKPCRVYLQMFNFYVTGYFFLGERGLKRQVLRRSIQSCENVTKKTVIITSGGKKEWDGGVLLQRDRDSSSFSHFGCICVTKTFLHQMVMPADQGPGLCALCS